eukprot:SAG22_NODE_4598_length_1221_cov_1.030303_2_plen_348_part_01
MIGRAELSSRARDLAPAAARAGRSSGGLMPLLVDVAGWEGAGKAAALAALQSPAPSAAGGGGVGGPKQVIYELAAAVCSGGLQASDVLELLESAECGTAVPDLPGALADIFWMQSLACEDAAEPEGARKALAALVQRALAQGWVAADTLKARLEPELLKESGVIEATPVFLRRVLKVKTAIMFTQKKFNLLREESEGYSKVVAELCQGKAGVTVATAPAIFEHIQALIGYFDLDPNRCFDLVLDAFEQDSSNRDAFVALVLLFQPSPACVAQVVGFKFRSCAKAFAAAAADAARPLPTPTSLQRLAAVLISTSQLRVEDLYIHLSPTDAEAREQGAAREAATKAAAAS